MRRTSLYTRAQMNPETTAAVIAGAVAVLWLSLIARRGVKTALLKSQVRAHEREVHRAR